MFVVLYVVFVLQSCADAVFTSSSQLKNVAEGERRMVAALEQYVIAEEQRLSTLARWVLFIKSLISAQSFGNTM
jgi:hypothetical protein